MGWIIASVFMLAVLTNGFAAGMAAVLYAWRVNLPPESRIFLASATAALAACGLVGLLALAGWEAVDDPPDLESVAIMAGTCLAVLILASLPGALVVTRKLEAGRGEFHAFE